jgi:hypothetical protein
MRAELIILGKRLDMAPQNHRQTMVVLIYAGMATLMTAFWFIDRWHVTGTYMIFATILVNRFLLGGYNFGGLIKPFNGKAPRNGGRIAQPPPFLMLALRVYPSYSEPEDRDYRNDERELQQRDRAHYYAYQGLSVALVLIWLFVNFKNFAPRLLSWIPVSTDLLTYGLALATIVVALTLPQAILLWTEPDMIEFAPEEEAGL